ncbi:glycosyltransferase family 2 protein [Carnobacterium pleistocenium]|uniref:glycosyltransferase family 2 protein n=1 Tax=Carnobacterium pleistocenium TaxID=181073 RepID=UPI00054E6A1A|nr:glycosyltransferase [Carnobacterium pleistocenium]
MMLIENFIYYFSLFILGYSIIVTTLYLILILVSWKRLREFIEIIQTNITSVSHYTKPISIVVPAYNEEQTIVESVRSFLQLDYPEFEVIVVNDGSTDETMAKLIHFFDLYPVELDSDIKIETNLIKQAYKSHQNSGLILLDKENGGKADALNAGINVSLYPLFCAIDADCIIEKDALLRIVSPFLKYEETIAVGGMVRIANGSTIKNGEIIQTKVPKKMIERFQVIEYFRAFLTSRVGWQRFNALMIISGAFGLFKKSAVLEVGGFERTIGEDMELVLRLHEKFHQNSEPYRIDFASDAVCWTQAPDSYKDLKSQRVRWHRGLFDSLNRHQKMLGNPKYGSVGLASMPYFFLVELFGPMIEMIGYIVMGLAIYLDILSSYVGIIFLLTCLMGILFSYSAILFEEISYKRYSNLKDILLLFMVSILEQFYYRPLTVWWRVTAFFNYRKGSKKWGTIERKNFDTKTENNEI